jgi:hypothetical protein
MTVPQQRSQQQPWPSTVAQQQRTPAAPQAQHRLVPVAAATPASTEGSTAMTVLRATAYVLTSLASLLFILLVIYGAVKLNQLNDALSTLPFGAG